MPSLVPMILDPPSSQAFTYSWGAPWPNAVLKVKSYRKKNPPTFNVTISKPCCQPPWWLRCWPPLTLAFHAGDAEETCVRAVTAWLRRTGEGVRREVRCDSFKWLFPGLPPLSWLLSSSYLWSGSFNESPTGQILCNQIRIKNARYKILCPVLSSYSCYVKNMKMFCSSLRSMSGCRPRPWSRFRPP